MTIIWTNVSYAIIYAKCSEKVFTKYISGFLFDIFIKLSKNLVLAFRESFYKIYKRFFI